MRAALTRVLEASVELEATSPLSLSKGEVSGPLVLAVVALAGSSGRWNKAAAPLRVEGGFGVTIKTES